MRMIAATFDEEEALETVTVVVPLDELAVMYRLSSEISDYAVTNASGGNARWGNAHNGFDNGAGNIFNTFFENGVDDVIPRFKQFDPADTKTLDQIIEEGRR